MKTLTETHKIQLKKLGFTIAKADDNSAQWYERNINHPILGQIHITVSDKWIVTDSLVVHNGRQKFTSLKEQRITAKKLDALIINTKYLTKHENNG